MQETQFNSIESALGPTIIHKGDNYLYFGGTAYLGIPQNTAFQKLFWEGVDRYGLNNGTSRNNNVQLGIYDEAEACAAQRFNSPSALIVSSGFLAAQLALKYLVSSGTLCYAPNTHPALWLLDPPNIVKTFADWAEETVVKINASRDKSWVIISNSMNNLYPERYDFSFVRRIHPDKEIVLLIDDSHGIGICNNGLTALQSIEQQKNVKVILVASMAKALGVDAGIMLGDKDLIEKIKGSSSFNGASPPAAAGLYAFMHADEIYRHELAKVKQLSSIFAAQLKEISGWHFIPDFPVFLNENSDLSQRLMQQQILVSAFPYPDKEGPLIHRIVLSSWHTTKDVNRLITLLA